MHEFYKSKIRYEIRAKYHENIQTHKTISRLR